jgi:murein DD-endopeptidase MepM/ murein hydrolase activator NlpD
MRRWEYHRTRSKVALLLLINLVTLLGGRYIALITLFKSELFGEASVLAKAPKKKLPKSHLSRVQPEAFPPPTTARQPVKRRGTSHGQRSPSHVVRRGETLASIAESYGISSGALHRANRLRHADRVLVGQKLQIAKAGARERAEWDQAFRASDRTLFLGGPRHLERRSPVPTGARPDFVWPVEGTLTSPFGERDHMMGGGGTQFHAGIDLSVPAGTAVRAAQEGIVVFAGYHGAYGKAVKLDHLNGFSTLYAHNSRVLVHVGQTVKAGQAICLSGSTGRSTGPHLHFEVHKDGWPVDPLQYLH